MRTGLSVILLAIVSALSATVAKAETISRCVLEVHNATFLNGPCNFEMGDDGGFTMGVGDTADEASLYFAYVGINEDDPSKAYGYWNGFPPENRAHEHLGELTRNGACWTSDTARVCAYK